MGVKIAEQFTGGNGKARPITDAVPPDHEREDYLAALAAADLRDDPWADHEAPADHQPSEYETPEPDMPDH
jgi:hypothetical protein